MSRGQTKKIFSGPGKVPLIDWNRDKAAQDYFARFQGVLAPRDVMLDASEAIAPDVVTIQWSYDFLKANGQVADEIFEVTTTDTDLSDLRMIAEWNTGPEKETAAFDMTRGGHVTVCAWHIALYAFYPNPPGPEPYLAGARPGLSVNTSISLRTKADHGMPKFTQKITPSPLPVGVESDPIVIPKFASRVLIANDNPAVPVMNIRQYRNQFAANPNTSAVSTGKTINSAVDIIEGALFLTVENPNPGINTVTRVVFLLDL